MSTDAHFHQARTVKFCADSKAVTSSLEKQTDVKPKVYGVKQAKNREGCRENTSKTNSSLGDVHTSRFCSADVSIESDTISAHSHVTSWSVNTSADSQASESQTNGKSFVQQQIAEEPSVARTKRTRNEEEWNQSGPWEVQACINSNEHPSNITLGRNTRHAKRNAEITLGAMSIPK